MGNCHYTHSLAYWRAKCVFGRLGDYMDARGWRSAARNIHWLVGNITKPLRLKLPQLAIWIFMKILSLI